MRLRLKGRRASVVTSALVNTGFESEEPELVIPEKLSEVLELMGSAIARFRAVARLEASGMRVDERITVELMVEDRDPVVAQANVTILPGEDEVIISDRLASELRIVILDPYGGSWCLSDEMGKVSRKSVTPEFW